jgi:lipopolysaccharide/colanic/teichoic acid biosynthesis glycosyltransferase
MTSDLRTIDRSFELVPTYRLTSPDRGRRGDAPPGPPQILAPAVLSAGTTSGSLRAKAILDRTLAGALLIVFALPLALVCLAIKIDSPGPAVFRQRRVGRHGREFTIFKLRSMTIDAERLRRSLQEQNEGAGLLFKVRHDPRVTRVGRLIRTTSIDELPQLWNVLRGDMSLVGPRPALPDEAARYDERERRRLEVKPGLTGLWQVSGRSRLDWETSIRLDLSYVESWSLLADLSILARTFGAVLTRDGAH